MNDFFEITTATGLSVTPAGCDLDARTKLNQLAGEINALAKDAEDSAYEAIYKAAECGEKLLQAKDLVHHGEWTAWLEANTHVSVRTSERWMKPAKAKAGDLPFKVNYTVAKRLLEDIDLGKYDTPDEAINDTVSLITPTEVAPCLPPTTGGSTPTTLGSTPSSLPGTAITVCGSTSADEILVRPMTDQEITKRAIAIKKAKRAERDAARAQRQAEALAVNHPLSGEAYKLVQAYARDIDPHVEDGSVDAIITDPPYSIEYIDCYRALAELAPRELKPGGHLLVMVGQLYLPEIIAALNQPPLVYRWTLNYRMGRPPAS